MKSQYNNFKAALYVRALDIAPLKDDISPFIKRFEAINEFIRVDKVYLETHRDLTIPAKSTLIALKQYFNEKRIETSAGITVTILESDNLRAFCYSDPVLREKLKEIVTLSAELFNEIVFDDFFFTNCKCPLCIAGKGKKSWTEFRLETMTEASKEIVLKTAKAVNPKVEVVIKYPNWYEHFQGLGFNLKDQPSLYAGVYTGNETRDAMIRDQHLQPYESYLVSRYYENIKPGGNRGGWVDPHVALTLDRYAEQFWLTLFAKAPEITLFDFHSLHNPIKESQRGFWQGQGTSLSFDGLTAPVRDTDGSLNNRANMAVAAGAALTSVDKVLGELGTPLGVKSYKPYHSMGEDFLHNYLGMLGIPMDLEPEFPTEASTILLTESAKHDTRIVEKIEKQLSEGKCVIITSGLLKALQGKGLEQIVELECTDRIMTAGEYIIRKKAGIHRSEKLITVSIIHYLTNDSWEEASLVSKTSGTPLFHSAEYGRSKLYILTIPHDYNDLYQLPVPVLNRMKEVICRDHFVRLEAPAQVTLFLYDNDTFIVESFLDETVEINLIINNCFQTIKEVNSSLVLENKERISLSVKPHSYRVFKANRGS
jgi:hypothetical protein